MGGRNDQETARGDTGMRRLGELEAEIMDRLWSWHRPATVREVVDDLNRVRPLAYTTVMTVAEILYNKGHLRRRKLGRAWLYEAVRTREEYTAELMADALDSSQDRSGALAHFAERISPDERQALRQTLDDLLRGHTE
jgi:predicted transcriptional regulator